MYYLPIIDDIVVNNQVLTINSLSKKHVNVNRLYITKPFICIVLCRVLNFALSKQNRQMTSFMSRGMHWLVTGFLAAVLVTVAMGDEQLEVDKRARPFLGKRHAPVSDSNDASERSESLEYNTDEEEQSQVEDDLTEEEQYQTIERAPSFSNEDRLTQFSAYNKRVRPFLGKRRVGDDMQAVVGGAKRARPFLGKRPRPFLGKRAGQGEGRDQSEEGMMIDTEELSARLLRLHPKLLQELQYEKRVRPFLG